MNQHIERLAAGGRDTGLRERRRADIGGRIGRGLPFSVDRVEFLVGITGEDKIVMAQMLVSTGQPEVENDAGTGGFVVAAVREPARCGMAGEQIGKGANGVAVGDHGGQGDGGSVAQFDPDGAVAIGEDAGDMGVGADFNAEFAGQACQCERDGASAADWIPDSFVALHVGDAAENGG